MRDLRRLTVCGSIPSQTWALYFRELVWFLRVLWIHCLYGDCQLRQATA